MQARYRNAVRMERFGPLGWACVTLSRPRPRRPGPPPAVKYNGVGGGRRAEVAQGGPAQGGRGGKLGGGARGCFCRRLPTASDR